MHKLAVIGNPIKHSLSPEIFSLFAKKANIALEYNRILADLDSFNKIVTNFFNEGGIALNITSPFKNKAFMIATLATSRSSFCQTSNFLYKNNENKIVADTTDGLGFIKDLTITNKYKITGKKVLIVGSGYVVDSILLDLVVLNPNNIDILARNSNKIEVLQNKFGIGIYQATTEYDLIINTTPNITSNNLFIQIKSLAKKPMCYDLSYQTIPTIFHQAMQKLNINIQALNGLGMLIEQAGIAFKHLFSIEPDIASTRLVLSTLKSPQRLL